MTLIEMTHPLVEGVIRAAHEKAAAIHEASGWVRRAETETNTSDVHDDIVTAEDNDNSDAGDETAPLFPLNISAPKRGRRNKDV